MYKGNDSLVKKITRISFLLLLFAGIFNSGCSGGSSSSSYSDYSNNVSKSAESVIFIQDGAIDEMMIPMLLKTMDGTGGNPSVDLKGIIIVDGDCWAFPTAEAQSKLNALISLNVPIGISQYEGINPFPSNYRNDCLDMNALPILNPQGTPNAWNFYDGDVLLKDLLSNAAEPVTILLNSGATTLATVLWQNPGLESKIKRLIWMGGAIDPKNGNVVYPVLPPSTLYYCEWNMYWDPTADINPLVNPSSVGAGWLFNNTSFPIILFPLDITDSFPIHYNVGSLPVVENPNAVAFHDKLAAQASQGYLYSQIALAGYNIPYNENWNNYYCLWDTVSAVYIAHPEFFATQGFDVTVSQNTSATDPQYLANPTPQGHLNVVANQASRIKAALNMAQGFDESAVYNYMSEQYKR